MSRPRHKKKLRPPNTSAVDTEKRLFLAVMTPPSVSDLVQSTVVALNGADWPVRWVSPESTHLTLHFLGETAPERAELLRFSLAPVVARHRTMTLQTTEPGVFPSERKPRVLWLGLSGEVDRLAGLQQDLGDALTALGFTVERRRFSPHLTLGRVRESAPPDFGETVKRGFAAPRVRDQLTQRCVPFQVESVSLMQSLLGPDGSRYIELARFSLQG